LIRVVALTEGHNGAHAAIAPLADTRQEIRGLMASLLGWTAANDNDMAPVVVDGGTRGNQMGVQYLLHSARMTSAFFDVIALKHFAFVPDTTVPPRLARYRAVQGVMAPKFLQNLWILRTYADVR
jgi:hypothetical protein